MAKATIKSINNPMGGTTSVSISVATTGAAGKTSQNITKPPGQVLTGVLVDDASGTPYNFSQPFGAELGLKEGEKVNYLTVTDSTGATVANYVKLDHRGEVVSIDPSDDNGGTLKDKVSGNTIPFAQTDTAESGIIVGSKVNFEAVIDPTSAQVTAVALVVVK